MKASYPGNEYVNAEAFIEGMRVREARQSRIVPATSEVVDEDIAWRGCIVEVSDGAAVAGAVIDWMVNAVEGNSQLAREVPDVMGTVLVTPVIS